MTWRSAAEFFEMGGHGLYVWGSYFATALMLAIEPWLSRRRRRRAIAGAAAGSPATDSPP